ncbi:hypothetical protein U9M48_020928 [Paspalum notatum var. saurae]|uniref:Uncharacterized protein n=1 Tax=Paspalum notatum var. saurae TaxID=547442 RepID=A0AAQ3TF97_PASNO
MSMEQRNELNKRRRELYQIKKSQASPIEDVGVTSENQLEDPDENSDWLHYNDSSMSHILATNMPKLPGDSQEMVDGVIPTTHSENPPKNNESRATYFRERSKNMTPDQKSAKREQLRLYNKTPMRMEANTLNQASIAMENPKFVPELVWPAMDISGSNGSPVISHDLIVPDWSPKPNFILPDSLQTEEIETSDMSPSRLRHKRHVPYGERHSLLARRNQLFEETIGETWLQLNKYPEKGTMGHNPRLVARDPGPTVITERGERMAAEGDNGTLPQMTTGVLNNDDDESVIFDEDEDEDEGYLFAGQDEDTGDVTEIDEAQDDSPAIPDVPDQYDKVYSNIPKETHMPKLFVAAAALQCKEDTPPELKRLWESADSNARHFRDNISMTTNMRDCGIYTFRAHGVMYHNLRSFGKEVGAEHKHLELYFYDDDPSLEHRYRRCREKQLEKDKEVVKHLVAILKGNPYSEHLRSIGHVDNLDDYRIELNLDQMLDQKTYNVPINSELP